MLRCGSQVLEMALAIFRRALLDAGKLFAQSFFSQNSGGQVITRLGSAPDTTPLRRKRRMAPRRSRSFANPFPMWSSSTVACRT